MFQGLFRQRCLPAVSRCVRFQCSQPAPVPSVDKAQLSKLRKKTGYPLLNCKKALAKFDNDFKAAESWMKEMAQKEGWSKAGKLQDRPMSAGLVGLLESDQSVTVVEVNCETDFVAKNEHFQSLVSQLAEACQKHFADGQEAKVEVEKAQLAELPAGNQTIGDMVALTVGTLGENIAIRRATFLRRNPEYVTSCFVHAAGPVLTKDGCTLGKYAAVVQMEKPDTESVAKQLCQHIIGVKPTEIGDWSPPPVVKKEQKKKKDTSEDETPKIVEEETRLLDQEFLMESKTVRAFLKDSAPKVVEFVRIECGEDLGED